MKHVAHFPRWTVLPILLSALLAFACNKDGEIKAPYEPLPRITVDSKTGVYTVKIGKTVKITPTVENGENARYSWTIDGKVVSTEPVFESVFEEEGRIFVTLRVDNSYGHDEMELRVDVVELALPFISFAVPSTGIDLLAGREYSFKPEVQNSKEATYAWYLNGSENPVSTEKDYTFLQIAPGTYTLMLRAKNEDGRDEATIRINVVETLQVNIVFLPSYYFGNPLEKSVSLGRTIFLRPFVENAVNPEYSWYVGDVRQEGQSGRMFTFTPAEKGEYTVRFRVTDADAGPEQSLPSTITRSSAKRISEVTLKVTCYERESDRRIVTTGQPASDKVLEFLPAPGQFVNEKEMADYADERTFDAARQYAEKRMKTGLFLSLGSFGGYVIVGFDHSIENKGAHKGYDFSIRGNQFDESNEPGIVWVMQDVNGNGKPDDEWYELRGCETGKSWTIQEYAVTYYKPGTRRQPVLWSDNQGHTGKVAYMGMFHPQDYYYPLWLDKESYTYYGTCLRQNTSQEPGGDFSNNAYDWGYVDNSGSDNIDDPALKTGKTYFKISNAMTLDGQPADLRYIDFVKIQTGTNGVVGVLGEISTEVVGQVYDENL